MVKLTFLPHEVICPDGATIEAEQNESILDAALRNKISIEHACEKSCACTTCHVVVREGWGLEPESRLSCQALVGDSDLVIEIPKYTINMVSEEH